MRSIMTKLVFFSVIVFAFCLAGFLVSHIEFQSLVTSTMAFGGSFVVIVGSIFKAWYDIFN